MYEFQIKQEGEWVSVRHSSGKIYQYDTKKEAERMADMSYGCNFVETKIVQRPATKAVELWTNLGDIPINEDEEIEQDFIHFEAGTDRFTIWHWFEEEFDLSVAKDLMTYPH